MARFLLKHLSTEEKCIGRSWGANSIDILLLKCCVDHHILERSREQCKFRDLNMRTYIGGLQELLHTVVEDGTKTEE